MLDCLIYKICFITGCWSSQTINHCPQRLAYLSFMSQALLRAMCCILLHVLNYSSELLYASCGNATDVTRHEITGHDRVSTDCGSGSFEHLRGLQARRSSQRISWPRPAQSFRAIVGRFGELLSRFFLIMVKKLSVSLQQIMGKFRTIVSVRHENLCGYIDLLRSKHGSSSCFIDVLRFLFFHAISFTCFPLQIGYWLLRNTIHWIWPPRHSRTG